MLSAGSEHVGYFLSPIRSTIRFPNDLKIKYFKKKITQSSVQYSGPKIWNTFSAKTKMSTKLSTMKRTLKREILSH